MALGQIYNGQILKGLILLVAYFISWLMMYIIIGFITTPILWICTMPFTWNRQDAAALRSLCGSELMRTWEQELADLRARGRKNRMDNIVLRSSEITEVWTETGQDYITVRLQANLLDYTVDEKSGAVLDGSDSEPVEFEEFWTFSRSVGPNPWNLAAVQQA